MPPNPSLHTQKVPIKMFRPSKSYPSRDTDPLRGERDDRKEPNNAVVAVGGRVKTTENTIH